MNQHCKWFALCRVNVKSFISLSVGHSSFIWCVPKCLQKPSKDLTQETKIYVSSLLIVINEFESLSTHFPNFPTTFLVAVVNLLSLPFCYIESLVPPLALFLVSVSERDVITCLFPTLPQLPLIGPQLSYTRCGPLLCRRLIDFHPATIWLL